MRVVKLGELPMEWKRGGGLRKSDITDDGKNHCILYGELFTKHKKVLIDRNILSKTNNIGKVVSKKGDILVPGTSTASKYDMILAREIDIDGVLIGGDINILRPEEGTFAQKYLAYYFDTLRAHKQLEQYITGTTGIIHISNSGIKNLEVLLLPFEEQRRIVKKLDEIFKKIDKAIELTQKNLQNSQELFESEKSRIFNINEWPQKKISDLGITQTGTTPKTENKNNYGNFIPFIKPSDFKKDGTIRYDNHGLSEAGLKEGRLIKANSVLMVCIGATIGKSGYCDRDISCNQQINTVELPSLHSARFVYYQISTARFYNQIVRYAPQTTMPILNKSNWNNLTVAVPEEATQESVVKKLDVLSLQSQKLQKLYQQKLDNLIELKQSLLKQAFEGKL